MQIKLIIKQLERVFSGPAWHGPTILETLEKIKNENSTNSYKDSHSLVEIIGHMIAWRNFVLEQLDGNSDFIVSDEMNFPKNIGLNDGILSLKASQKKLMEAIAKFPEERLKDKVGSRPFSFQTMLHGIIHHDLYHLGQLALLNR